MKMTKRAAWKMQSGGDIYVGVNENMINNMYIWKPKQHAPTMEQIIFHHHYNTTHSFCHLLPMHAYFRSTLIIASYRNISIYIYI